MSEETDLEKVRGFTAAALSRFTVPADMLRYAQEAQQHLIQLAEEVERLRLKVDSEGAVLAMTVARLGGMVEGHPTARLNFLQRVDELRGIERENAKLQEALGDCKNIAAEKGLSFIESRVGLARIRRTAAGALSGDESRRDAGTS